MKLEKKDLSLKKGLEKEWIITNGLGAYASSTVVGANTRRYHGLLVAPLLPPAQRHVLISKLDESIKVDGKEYILYTNVCKDYVSNGYKYLSGFEKEYVPKFIYNINGIIVEKTITMMYMRNTVIVSYRIVTKSKPVTLCLSPVINFRDFHKLTTNEEFDLKQIESNGKVRVEVNGEGSTPIYIYVAGSTYLEHKNDTFRNMYYIKEMERGFDAEENLAVPGTFEVQIGKNEEKVVTFIGSLEDNIEEINGVREIERERQRLDKIVLNTGLVNSKNKDKNEFLKALIVASDSFIVDRPSFGTHSIIAGFPWFLDWGRDALISYEGLVLVTKRFDLAKEILLTFTRDIKYGLVPNGYSGYDNRPLYNSVDASLLLFEDVNKYLAYTNDYEFIKDNIYEYLIKIINGYCNGINIDNNNIYIDVDGLIVSGTETTQNTWMDAKIGDYAVTPRNGKAVEINALWYNALRTLQNLAKKFGNDKIFINCKEMANKCKLEFNEKFYNNLKKCLYDVLGDDKVRPNQLFAFSTTYPVWDLKSETTTEILKTIKTKLYTKHGLRTLAKDEKGYISTYEGDSTKRDMSYHQGIPWPWLLGLYYDSLNNIMKATTDKTKKHDLKLELKTFKKDVYDTFKSEINEPECIGSISEIYDGVSPYKARGACSQAWSVAEILRIVK